MINFRELEKLAKEAAELINNFKYETKSIFSSEFINATVGKHGKTVVVNNKDEEIEYTIEKISYALETEFGGKPYSGNRFFQDIEIEKLKLGSNINEINKDEFIKEMGTLCYIECVGESIYLRLKEIEAEAMLVIE